MAALPYIQLYVADYLADTAHLKAIEHGAYLLLIMNYWQTGKPLNNANERLTNVARMSKEEWNESKETLQEFFKVDGDTWTHLRIEADLFEVNSKATKASDAGKKSAEARRLAKLNGASTDVQQPLNHTETETETDTETDTETKTGKSKDLSLPSAPTASKKGTRLPEDWVLPKAWGEFALSENAQWSADDVRRIAADFKDFWIANSNRPIGKKADWLATWRIWVRKESKSAKSNGFKTTAEKRADNTGRAIAEFLGEAKTIEGEVVDA